MKITAHSTQVQPPFGCLEQHVETLFDVSRAALILRGILFLILGGVIFVNPGPALIIITMIFGIFIVFDGVILLITGRKWIGCCGVWNRWAGFFLILLGLCAVIVPFMTDFAWIVFCGFWEIVSGFQGIWLSFTRVGHRALTFIGGILSILLGVVLIVLPFAGFLAFSVAAGALCFAGGILMIAMGIGLHRKRKTEEEDEIEPGAPGADYPRDGTAKSADERFLQDSQKRSNR